MHHDIYTIGHSNRSLESFIDILLDNKIRCLVDVRSYPGSRAVPQFNKENLAIVLPKYRIRYIHIADLGGRRKVKTNIHVSIEAPAFAGYADWMMTSKFKKAYAKLERIASKCKTAIMCAEATWWRCHRRMISDKLVFDNWEVYHLGLKTEPVPHQIWDVARLDKNGDVIYDQ